MAPESPLKREFEYYIANQAELVKRYNGRFIVVKNQAVLGDYPDPVTAARETARTHELGTFLVQKVEAGQASYSQTFHSRVAFA